MKHYAKNRRKLRGKEKRDTKLLTVFVKLNSALIRKLFQDIAELAKEMKWTQQ
jgi:hypothetical protein